MEVISTLSIILAGLMFGLLLKQINKTKKNSGAIEKYKNLTFIFLLIFLPTTVLAIPEIKTKKARALKEIMARDIKSKVEIKEVKVTEEIPFQTQTKNEGKMPKGQTKVQQEGIKGKIEKKYKIVFLNGEEERRELLSENIVSQPTAKIILTGTYVARPTLKKLSPKKSGYQTRR